MGEVRTRERQEAGAAELQDERRQHHRAAGRCLDVRIQQSGVHREHRDLDRETQEKREEQPHLFGGGQRQLHQVRDLPAARSEEHTSELQSLMRISYAVFCLKKKNQKIKNKTKTK